MVSPELLKQIDLLGPLVVKAIVGLIVTGLLGAFMWPFRKAHKEWSALKLNIAETHKELVQQRTNCLTTLQAQGISQIDLLTKTVRTLEGARRDLAEQTGYLSAMASVPLRPRRTAKK